MNFETDAKQVSVISMLDFGKICTDDSFYGPHLQMFHFYTGFSFLLSN